MYAVVKAGGKQHKVAVGDVVEVNRLEGEAGDAVSLPALLLVDGRSVISETSALARITVTGEIVGQHKGPKIKILKYKNKTGYRKRIGHRQLLTELLVTDIDDGKPKKKADADGDTKPAKRVKTAPNKAAPTKASVKESADDKPRKVATAAAAKASKATKTANPRATPEKASDSSDEKED